MQQGTTIGPMMNGGPEEEGPLTFVGNPNPYRRRLREAYKSKELSTLGEGSEFRGKPAKAFMDEATGVGRNKGKTATVTRSTAETISEPKGKKRGPFGESYSPVSAGSKGVRAKESQAFREFGVQGMKWGELKSKISGLQNELRQSKGDPAHSDPEIAKYRISAKANLAHAQDSVEQAANTKDPKMQKFLHDSGHAAADEGRGHLDKMEQLASKRGYRGKDSGMEARLGGLI